MTAAGAAPGEWGVALASDDVRDAALALTVPRACRERAKSAALIGAAAQGVSLLGIAFGAAPPALAPIAAVLAAGFALAVVREPTTLPPAR
jgi:Cu+-exporting ATPase